VAWKQDIPGRGWSSPVVWGNQVFLTTVVNRGVSEDPKKGLYFGGERKDPVDAIHEWHVISLDLESGNVLWKKTVHEGKPATPIHIKNSYASETPVTDGEHLYVYFGNLGVFCLDFDGEVVWDTRFEAVKLRFGWGTAASPVLHEDTLYIVNDNEDESYLVALDKVTGDERWKVTRDEDSNWSTPYLWTNVQRTEIVTPGTDMVRSYDLEGNLLWHLKGMSSITIATPYASNGILYISSGYVGDRKSRPIYAIKPGASGDISLGEEETANEYVAWSDKFGAPYNPSTIVYEDRLYVLYDRGRVACYNAADGSVIYEPQRLPRGAGYTTSPWAYDGKLFCLNEDGVTHVVQAGDTFEVLHTNTLAEDDMGMSSPAIVGDRLLLRTAARIYCIKNP
jgi:outer membrane protein assembly factor BamB